MPRLLYTPTDDVRRDVAERIMAGATEEDLAAYLNIPVKRIKKVFRNELRQSPANAKHEVLSQLYKAAKSGSNTTASIFWAKARYGWRDTGALDKPMPDFWPPHFVDIKNETVQ